MAEPIITPPFDDLAPLPRRRLVAMRAAARDLFAVLEAGARKGSHPVGDPLAASPEAFTRWTYYPPEPVDDAKTGSGWFYHAHEPSEARRWSEHGHFHCFSLVDRLRKGAKPLALPADPDPDKARTVHLVAISIEQSGVPQRLFATNRWVTGEWMHAAGDVVPLIDEFAIHTDKRFRPTSRWLSAMLRLFQPQIAWLLHERDLVIGERRAQGADDFTEDQKIEAVAVATIDVDAQLAALDRAWKRQSRRRAA
ncbi:MAG: hypothetical protein K2Y71_26470 [Xanthobacteraceae bacterium]|nr:hypothetical protein [Xanthobacteraceae bacterium]